VRSANKTWSPPHTYLLADGLVSTAEAARSLSVSRSFLYVAMGRGELPYVKLGRARRIPRRALIEFVAARLRGSTAGSAP
jgi:excisionase family DNA binding protein